MRRTRRRKPDSVGWHYFLWITGPSGRLRLPMMKHSAQALFNRYGPYCPDRIIDTQKQEREGPASTYDTTRVRTTRIENWNDVPDLEAAWTALLNRAPGH